MTNKEKAILLKAAQIIDKNGGFTCIELLKLTGNTWANMDSNILENRYADFYGKYKGDFWFDDTTVIPQRRQIRVLLLLLFREAGE